MVENVTSGPSSAKRRVVERSVGVRLKIHIQHVSEESFSGTVSVFTHWRDKHAIDKVGLDGQDWTADLDKSIEASGMYISAAKEMEFVEKLVLAKPGFADIAARVTFRFIWDNYY